jgi:sulfate adenylyltransferase
VATRLDTCEARDPKGLYARARNGLLPHFTGVTDPYESPTDADVVIDTDKLSVDAAVLEIVNSLRERATGMVWP